MKRRETECQEGVADVYGCLSALRDASREVVKCALLPDCLQSGADTVGLLVTSRPRELFRNRRQR